MSWYTVGIDVSKAKLDVCLLGEAGETAYEQMPNTRAGYEQLLGWLQQHTPQLLPICLEATGIYSQPPAQYLHQQQYPVSLVNPAPVKAFAAALMKRHKTDKSDALVLARYAAQFSPPLWSPPTLTQSQLHDLKRLADDLQADRTRVKNRLEGTSPGSPTRPYLQDQLAYLEKQLAQIQQELQKQVDEDQGLQSQCHLLTSIIGIGIKSAIQILAELPELSRFGSADALVAYAGLCPRQQQSGSQIAHSWLSKQGSAALRKALYFPALTAKLHNPHLRHFALRLRDAGKAKMTVVAAVMRKLLVLIFAILKSGHPYDPNYSFAA